MADEFVQYGHSEGNPGLHSRLEKAVTKLRSRQNIRRKMAHTIIPMLTLGTCSDGGWCIFNIFKLYSLFYRRWALRVWNRCIGLSSNGWLFGVGVPNTHTAHRAGRGAGVEDFTACRDSFPYPLSSFGRYGFAGESFRHVGKSGRDVDYVYSTTHPKSLFSRLNLKSNVCKTY